MFSFEEAAAFYRASAARCEPELSNLVLTVVHTAEGLARGYIGHQQSGWAPLSSATIDGFRHELGFWIEGKDARGFSGPDFEPLLGDTQELRDSITSEVAGLVGIVGSDNKKALWQEMGTSGRYPIPPRPVFAKSLMEAEVLIEELAGELLASLLMVAI